MIKNQQFVYSKQATFPGIFSNKGTEFWRQGGISHCHANRITDFLNTWRLFTLYQKRLKHARYAKITTIDKAQAHKSVDKQRISWSRFMMEDILWSNSGNEPARVTDL